MGAGSWSGVVEKKSRDSWNQLKGKDKSLQSHFILNNLQCWIMHNMTRKVSRFNLNAVDFQQPAMSKKQRSHWPSVSAHSSVPVFLNWQWRRHPGQKEQQRGWQREIRRLSTTHWEEVASTRPFLDTRHGCFTQTEVVMVMFVESGRFVFIYILTSCEREHERVYT